MACVLAGVLPQPYKRLGATKPASREGRAVQRAEL